jgi:hypothetical protein
MLLIREGLGYRFWAIAFMDAVLLPVGYICTPGNFASSIRKPDKPSIYEQRHPFDDITGLYAP